MVLKTHKEHVRAGAQRRCFQRVAREMVLARRALRAVLPGVPASPDARDPHIHRGILHGGCREHSTSSRQQCSEPHVGWLPPSHRSGKCFSQLLSILGRIYIFSVDLISSSISRYPSTFRPWRGEFGLACSSNFMSPQAQKSSRVASQRSLPAWA